VVVVVHGIQQSSAEATIFWDNYFAEAVRKQGYYKAWVNFLFRNDSYSVYLTKYLGLCSVKHLAIILNSKQGVA